MKSREDVMWFSIRPEKFAKMFHASIPSRKCIVSYQYCEMWSVVERKYVLRRENREIRNRHRNKQGGVTTL